MDDSFEDSFEELSDEYLSEEDLTAERTALEKAAQRKDYDGTLIKDSYDNIKEPGKAIKAYWIDTNFQFSIYKAEAGFMSKEAALKRPPTANETEIKKEVLAQLKYAPGSTLWWLNDGREND